MGVPLNPISFLDIQCMTYVGSEETAAVPDGERNYFVKLFIVTFRVGYCSSGAFLGFCLGGNWFEYRE